MTFGVIWEVGHKFNRGKSVQCKLWAGTLWRFFFVAAWGLVKDAVSASKKPYWVEREGTSVLFLFVRLPKHCHTHTNFTIITRTRLLDAI